MPGAADRVAAPAPHDATDKRVNLWCGSVVGKPGKERA